MSQCTTCAADLPPDARFCAECGTAVPVRACPACGQPADRGRFCIACGTPLDREGSADPAADQSAGGGVRPVAERRVTSVLFGDLVGFTSLSEDRDPEEVRELLSRYFNDCRTVVGRYGGTVEKFIGDAVMAVWGVPTAHEDDAERAVRAGLELVATVTAMGEDVGAPGLALRVGVVTGEVAVTIGATAEGMVAGDAVNTAARVQSVAEAGQVWVDDATRSLTASAITFSAAGEHLLKGKAEPLALFTAGAVVAELGGGQRVDGLEAPLTGRDRELRLLKELFHATQESLRPRLVVVDGEPGVGKSRLVWEFEKYADGLSATVRWHRGRCLSYGEGVSFWSVAEAVRTRLGLTESDSGAVVEERLDQGLSTFVPDLAEREWVRPRLAALVGAGQRSDFSREELFVAWTTWFERISEGGNAVVLVIDDAQHADDALVAFVEHLLSGARAGIFVLAVARPELLARRPSLGGRRATVIRLDPLDDASMARLVDGLVVGLSTASRAALVQRSEGVPLFAVETVRALIDRDAVVPRDGHYVPAEGSELDLDAIGAPASLQALVAARLDALSLAERLVIADASVLGTVFTRDGLVALGAGGAELDTSLASLQRKEILTVQQDRFAADRGQFRFVQSVVRQVAYATQSRRDRKVRHLAAAEHLALQPDPGGALTVVIAQHLLDAVDAAASGEQGTEELVVRACALLERAAVRANSLGSPAEARRLYEAALVRALGDEDRARLHLAAARASSDSGDYRGAIEHASTASAAFDALGRPVDAGVSAGIQAYALALVSDPNRAIEVAEPRWRALDGVPGAEPALLQIATALGRAHGDRGENAEMVRYVERRLWMAEATGDPDAIANAMITMGTRYAGPGAPTTARALYEAAAGIARDRDRPSILAHALNNLSSVMISRDLTVGLRAAQEGFDVARRAGVAGMIDYTTLNLISALWASGALIEARALADEAESTMSIPSLRLALRFFQTRLADALGLPEPPVAASADLEGGGDTEADRTLSADLQVWHLLAAGDASAAAAVAADALPHLLGAMGIDDDFMHLWPLLAEAAIAAEDLALAERMLRPVDSAAPGIVSAGVAAHWHLLRGFTAILRGDSDDVVEEELQTGLDALAAFGAVGLHAQAQEQVARWLTERGRPDDAGRLLTAARQTYQRIHADGWLAGTDSRHDRSVGAATTT